jgi:hypothetical protein
MRRRIAGGVSHLGLLLFAAGAIFGVPSRTVAQQATAADSTAIVRAALEYHVHTMRQKRHVAGPVRFDPRPMYTTWLAHPTFRAESIGVVTASPRPQNWKSERTPERLEAITRGLGVEIGRLEEVVVECPQGPRTCRMNGADAMIVASEPGIVDGVAKIHLQVATFRDDPRQPLGRALYELTLSCAEGGWRVTDAVLMGGT